MASPKPTPAPLQVLREKTTEQVAAGARDKKRDVFVGPFLARDEQDVNALRRETGLHPEAVKEGSAENNAKAWLSRKNQEEKRGLTTRQRGKRQTAAEQKCYVGNNQLSCYPTTGLRVNQGTWSKFIWNTNYPLFTNNGGYVDVYLFHQDTDTIATTWSSLSNDQGRLSFSPTDSWWQGRAAADNFNGTDIAWPFYFVITYAGEGLGSSTTRLSTWYAVQTAQPTLIAASRSSASLASLSAATLTGSAASSLSASEASASSSLAASLTSALVSSLTAQGFTGTETLQSTATATLPDGHTIIATATGQANGRLPSLKDDSSTFPNFAIALIVVFGFLALIGAIVGLYFLLAAIRKRRQREMDGDGEDSKMESRTPMMRQDQPYSDEPMSATETNETPIRDSLGITTGQRGGVESSDESNQEIAPFSSSQATRMAEAYRAALREPAFDQNGEGTDEFTRRQTMMSQDDDDRSPLAATELIREELKAEGHDLRRVEERRKPEMHD